jgi:hypothetical protein
MKSSIKYAKDSGYFIHNLLIALAFSNAQAPSQGNRSDKKQNGITN